MPQLLLETPPRAEKSPGFGFSPVLQFRKSTLSQQPLRDMVCRSQSPAAQENREGLHKDVRATGTCPLRKGKSELGYWLAGDTGRRDGAHG